MSHSNPWQRQLVLGLLPLTLGFGILATAGFTPRAFLSAAPSELMLFGEPRREPVADFTPERRRMMAFALTPRADYIIHGTSPSVRSVFQLSVRPGRPHHAGHRSRCIDWRSASSSHDEVVRRRPEVH